MSPPAAEVDGVYIGPPLEEAEVSGSDWGIAAYEEEWKVFFRVEKVDWRGWKREPEAAGTGEGEDWMSTCDELGAWWKASS